MINAIPMYCFKLNDSFNQNLEIPILISGVDDPIIANTETGR